MENNFEFLETALKRLEQRILENARDNLEITLEELRQLTEIGRIQRAIERKRSQFNYWQSGSG